MNRARSEAELRSVVSTGLSRLQSELHGTSMARVARAIGVERSTVSRWLQQRSTPSASNIELLAKRWPEHFDMARLAELQYLAARGGGPDVLVSVGIELHSTPIEVCAAATQELLRPPTTDRDRCYRHTAFHLDHRGSDPAHSDDSFGDAERDAMVAFQHAVAQRAREGWRMQLVVSTGNPSRLDSVERMVRSVDGPNVEIFAFPFRLPLVMAPIVIGQDTVLITRDHRRWERPTSCVVVRSRPVAAWAGAYFDDLIADAPFTLRSPRGVEPDGLAAFGDDVSRAAG